MGPVRTLFGGLARVFDSIRKILHFIVLIVTFSFIGALFTGPGVPRLPASGALIIDPQGPLVEQLSGDAVDRAFAELQGDPVRETLVRDVVAAIEHARDDDSVNALVLRLDGLAGGGITKLQRVADAVRYFKESEKPVIAYGDFFSQSQYFLASHADEVHLHPSGVVFMEGYGRYRTFYKSAIDKLSIDWNVFKVGEYKSFVEPYFRDSMSAEDKASSSVWLEQLWRAYQDDVTAARGLDGDAVSAYAAEFVSRAQSNGGDLAAIAVDAGFVDELSSRDEFEARARELAGAGEGSNPYSGVSFSDYNVYHGLGSAGSPHGGSAVGVVVASGQILDGHQPPGAIGGETLASLIRKARNDNSLRALVLHVDSGGGSKFASEVIQRELVLWRESGRPLVAVMSSVAASGGYWIAMDADEIWASPQTITGSIGIGGYFPTFQRTLDRLGVHVDGIGTTQWTGQFRADRELSEEAGELIQQNLQHGYRQFISGVAEARDMTADRVDAIARGRVWSGADAQNNGLVDRMGDIDDAIASAANLAGLGEDYAVRYLEKELNFREQLATMFAARATSWFGEEIAARRKPSTLARIEDTFGLSALRREVDSLLQFNDPQGLYYYCFCVPR